MADGVFNISKGKVAELAQRVLDNDPATALLAVHLWEGVDVADSVIKDYETVAAIEAGTLVEASFTNYAKKDITDSGEGLAVAVDQGNDRMEANFDDVTWTVAGNGANDTLVRLTISYDGPGTDVDATMPPMCFYDFDVLTDGSDITAQLDALGFFRAA